MDIFKKIYGLITEIDRFIPDILLFFQDGKEYFVKIAKEDFLTNTYRLILYIVFSLLLQTFFITETPKFDYSLIKAARTILFQLPILSFSYLIAMFLFSNSGNKVKLCLNYVVFQQMITSSIVVFIFAAFIHSESYFFYFMYAICLLGFTIFVFGKFIFLFFDGWLKKLLGTVALCGSVIVFAFVVSYSDFHTPKGVYLAFEDPIASEFYNLECFDEIENTAATVNLAQERREELIKLADVMNKYMTSEPSADSEATMFISTKKAKQIKYIWNLDKEKEYAKIEHNISILKQKLSTTRYNKNRDILTKNIETYNQYKDFLDEYNKTLAILASLDYENLSVVKQESFANSSTNVAETMGLVKKILMTQGQIDILKLNLKMDNVFTKMVNNHIENTNKILAYVKFTNNIKKYFPLYYRSFPES